MPRLGLLFLLLLIPMGLAQEEERSIFEFSLDELFDTRVSIASVVEKPLREQPGIVTVMHAEEIRNSGARNLAELLGLIPGLHMATDVFGQHTLLVRGLWTMEGKVLLEIDGHVYNDVFWGNLALDNHFPVAHIQELAVIRGPGSAQYGDYAELSVIRIRTDLKEGWYVSQQNGQMGGSHRSNTIAAVQTSRGALNLSASAYHMTGNMSDRRYTGPNGGIWDMSKRSAFTSKGVALAANYGELAMRYHWDEVSRDFASVWGPVLQGWGRTVDPAHYLQASYTWKLGARWSLTPEISYQDQRKYDLNYFPDETDTVLPAGPFYVTRGKRTKLKISALYRGNTKLNLRLGAEQTRVDGEILHGNHPLWHEVPEDVYLLGGRRVAFTSQALFGQLELSPKFVDLTVGARYATHDAFDQSAFVPRIAITRVWDKKHLKVLYSQAFRVGDLEHINLSDEPLQPERAEVMEVAMGFELNPALYVSGNVFSQVIKDAIIFTDADTTGNVERFGSRGFELEAQWRRGALEANMSYARYQAQRAEIPLYLPVSTDNAYLAAPRWKFVGRAGFGFNQHYRIDGNLVAFGSQYDFNGLTGVEQKIEGKILLNFMVHRRVSQRFTASLGVYDFFDEGMHYVQAYRSDFAPVPGADREWSLRLTWKP